MSRTGECGATGTTHLRKYTSEFKIIIKIRSKLTCEVLGRTGTVPDPDARHNNLPFLLGNYEILVHA